MANTITRRAYATMYGPTTGDRIRLADTELFIRVEQDLTIHGEEVKFGGGKVIRDGMGQSQRSRAEGAVDTVITNAVILDHWGIIKADVGLRGGRIFRIGKAGNPDVQPGVDIIIGPGTEVPVEDGQVDRLAVDDFQSGLGIGHRQHFHGQIAAGKPLLERPADAVFIIHNQNRVNHGLCVDRGRNWFQ